MSRLAILVCIGLALTGCKTKKKRQVMTADGSGAAVTGSGALSPELDAELTKAADVSAAAFEKYVEQFVAVAKSYDGKNCDAFVAQIKTLEPKLREFSLPIAKYANDPQRMLAVEAKLKSKLAAMEGRMADPAVGEKFKQGVEACETHPEMQGALERGMMRRRKPPAAAAPAGSATAGSAAPAGSADGK